MSIKFNPKQPTTRLPSLSNTNTQNTESCSTEYNGKEGSNISLKPWIKKDGAGIHGKIGNTDIDLGVKGSANKDGVNITGGEGKIRWGRYNIGVTVNKPSKPQKPNPITTTPPSHKVGLTLVVTFTQSMIQGQPNSQSALNTSIFNAKRPTQT